MGLERTTIATIFPTKPNTEIRVSNKPIMNLNVVSVSVFGGCWGNVAFFHNENHIQIPRD